MPTQTIVLLLMAIACEVTGTTALKMSEGFSRLGPSLVVIVGYGLTFYLLSMVLKMGMPLGTAYAIWSGLGTAGTAIIGVLLWQDKLNAGAIAGLVMVIAGVVLLNLNVKAHG